MIRTSVLTVGNRHNQASIWIEGLFLKKAGFNKGDNITVRFNSDSIMISKENAGVKIVSGKKYPIIDINNSQVGKLFNISEKIKVLVELGKITITKTRLALRKLSALKNHTHAELFGGIGLMAQAFKEAGFKTKWTIEKNEKYASIYQRNHDGEMYNSDIVEVDLDKLEKVEVISGGIPCENFSKVRRNENQEEAETMDLAMFAIHCVEIINPRTVLFEQVPQFLTEQIGVATINALKRLGYNVKTKIFTGNEYGMIQRRQRAVILASYDDIDFPETIPYTGTAKDILLDPEDPRCEWFSKKDKAWIWEHNAKQKAKGNNFQMVEIIESTTSIPAITKRYNAIRPADPFVKHPTKELWRLFSLVEQRRLFGLPEDYDLGEFKTYGGEGMGQGVLVTIFKKIAQQIYGTVFSGATINRLTPPKSPRTDLMFYM